MIFKAIVPFIFIITWAFSTQAQINVTSGIFQTGPGSGFATATLSLQQAPEAAAFYPNPVSLSAQFIHTNLPANTPLTVYTAHSQQIATYTTVTLNSRITLRTLGIIIPGTYFIRHADKTHKLVVL